MFSLIVPGYSYWKLFSYATVDLETIKEKGLDRDIALYIVRESYVTSASSTDLANESVAGFTFSPFPACCGVVVSTGSWNRTLPSTVFHNAKEAFARYLGYSYIVATTQLRNFSETVGAVKNGGWHLHEAFLNTRTDNDLVFMTKKLSK